MGCFFEGKDDTVLTEIITFLVGIIVDYSGGTEEKCNSRLFFYFLRFYLNLPLLTHSIFLENLPTTTCLRSVVASQECSAEVTTFLLSHKHHLTFVVTRSSQFIHTRKTPFHFRGKSHNTKEQQISKLKLSISPEKNCQAFSLNMTSCGIIFWVFSSFRYMRGIMIYGWDLGVL